MKLHLSLLLIILGALRPLATSAQTQTPAKMKAIVYHEFGSPDVLRLEEVAKPVPSDDQILIKIKAASVNPLDWHYMEGTPYLARLLGFGLFKPTVERLGVDYAGTVEAVGKNVTQFKPGDDVFGGKTGAFAEYVCVLADRAVAHKPARVTFEQAAAVPIAGVTALQALRDKAKLQSGQKVLINGASGGVGTFAVQIAKSMGAEVTGVCSGRNAELVRSLGADHVVDYNKEDFTQSGQRYDVIIDNVGNHSLLACRRTLTAKGRYVLIGGGGMGEQGIIGPLVNPLRALLLSPFVSQQMGMMMAELNEKDLTALADLIQAGKVTPVIDRSYPLSETADALRYLEGGHARGKVVINLETNSQNLPPKTEGVAASAQRSGATLIALELIALPLGVLVLPIILALLFNRRFQQDHPAKKPYRWGYYFSLISFLAGLVLGGLIGDSVWAAVVGGVIYGAIAWCFAQRQHWAWITLTILSFNPVAWIINFFYLRKRWAEQ